MNKVVRSFLLLNSHTFSSCQLYVMVMGTMKYLQLTFAILKPHIVKNPVFLKRIRNTIIENNFKVVRSRRKIITMEEANLFYQEHEKKFFYNRLVTFVTSGPSEMYILANEDAIIKWRKLLGPTKAYQAQFSESESIRGLYGLSDTRNAAHGSDSEESAEREMKIFFQDFDPKEWNLQEEEYFRTNKVKLDPLMFVHKILKNIN